MKPFVCFGAKNRAVLGRIIVTSLLALFLSGLAATARAQHIISFDAPGADMTSGSFNGTFANAVNNFGVITGFYIDSNDVSHAFIRYPDGKFTSFEVPGADMTVGSFNGTSAASINDAGVVTGEYFDASGESHGFLRGADGKITKFDVPGAGGYGTTPIALNVEGGVVGYYSDSNFEFGAFLRNPDGKVTKFAGPGVCTGGTPAGCYGNEATNINFLGTVAGNYMDGNFMGHGMIRRPDGSITTYEAPGAGTGQYQGTGCPGCYAGLNQWGVIAATYIDNNSVSHGYVRNLDGKIVTFDAPGAGTAAGEGTGCGSDCQVSLNDFGAIVGTYIDSTFTGHGYLRNPSGKIVTVDPPGSQLTEPSNINDLGVFTGIYVDANDVYHGFLFIP
jgi:hypothetical protein